MFVLGSFLSDTKAIITYPIWLLLSKSGPDNHTFKRSRIRAKMLYEASGRILFWLDGHYSGEGTACGDQISPILKELYLIRAHPRNDHCILIDDARLFTGSGGYPTIEATIARLLAINSNYHISVDRDCIVALPVVGVSGSSVA